VLFTFKYAAIHDLRALLYAKRPSDGINVAHIQRTQQHLVATEQMYTNLTNMLNSPFHHTTRTVIAASQGNAARRPRKACLVHRARHSGTQLVRLHSKNTFPGRQQNPSPCFSRTKLSWK
jgi:hypothetical protein